METQGEFYAGKLMDFANYGTTAMIFGKFVEGRMQWLDLGIGIVWYLALSVVSFFLRKGGQEKK